ncbi:MAG: ABC transporter ATP-binding protein [Burkholderiaceae bacterium]|jgi:branched-chain amino acid transport system ATP-binding protein|nr:ABC transporter ATP-binding protein [Burkholderiaceae bacterium]
MLHLSGLQAFYGKSHVLRGVSLDLAEGEIVALLGRNGSGRSTLAKAIMGMVSWQGVMRWHGRDLAGLQTFEIARAGIGYVPESRDVFPTLTVEQNLLLGEKPGGHGRRNVGERAGADAGGQGPRWASSDMYAMFPQLHARRHVPAGVLSGGEQQMLTLCRTLMGAPRFVIVDEPTEGLAPMVCAQIARHLSLLKERGLGVLLIEQKLDMALDVADRVVLMGQGEVRFDGPPAQFLQRPDLRREWLEVSDSA